MKSCFFVGHRDTPNEVFYSLIPALEHHIKDLGVTEFIVGWRGRFDYLAGHTVRLLKREYPFITLTMLLSYHPAERPVEVPPMFDGTFYPPGMENVPRRYAIARANRYMIDHVDYLVAYAWYPSNARNLLDYARKREQAHKLEITLLPRE